MYRQAFLFLSLLVFIFQLVFSLLFSSLIVSQTNMFINNQKTYNQLNLYRQNLQLKLASNTTTDKIRTFIEKNKLLPFSSVKSYNP